MHPHAHALHRRDWLVQAAATGLPYFIAVLPSSSGTGDESLVALKDAVGMAGIYAVVSGAQFRAGATSGSVTAAATEAFRAHRSEGVAAVLEPGSGMGDSGSVLVASGGSRDAKDPPVPVQLAVATEHYNRIARLLGTA